MSEAPAVTVGSAVVRTYRQLAGNAAALAAAFSHHLELRPGDRVALLMENCPAYVETLFACWWAGLVVVPINAKLHPREVAYILADCGASLLVVSNKLEGVAAEAIITAPVRHLVLAEGTQWRAMKQRSHAPIVATDADAPAWLFYTSGTTGRPKGATLNHANLFAMCGAYATDVDRILPGERLLHAAPMSHGSGLYLLPSVAGFGCQLIPETGGFEPDEIYELLATTPNMSFFAAPTMVGRLVRGWPGAGVDPTNLKTVIYGGGPMYLTDIEAALDALGPRFVQIYGQGETPMTITVVPKWMHADSNHPRYRERLASVGYPQSPVEVIVAGPEGQPLPTGEIGEILVRGATVMRGYWNNPDATARTLTNNWLATGDVGAFDADGLLTLHDRSKDVIISGGSNIYPREVEEILLRHPAVREVSVVGRTHPDWGEEVVAFVVAEGEVTVNALDRLCIDHIARFKRPRHYRFVSALPKNSYGKVLKTELRATLTECD